MTHPIEPEVMPAERHNSEAMRLAANQAIQAHMMTKAGAQMFAVGAIACGHIMSTAKERLIHGQFEAWESKYLKSIPRSTRKRYMQMFTAWKLSENGKCPAVGHLLSAAPADLTQNHIQRIAPQIIEVLDGRTFAELGRELGVFKPRETRSVRAGRRIGKLTGDKEVDHQHLARLWVEDLERITGEAENYPTWLSSDDLNRAIRALVTALSKLGYTQFKEG